MPSSSKHVRTFVFAAILLAVAVAALAGQVETKILVVSIVGDWKYGNARVRFGQSLTPVSGACLSTSDGSIVLRSDDSNGSLHPFACEKPFRDPQCPGQDGARCAVQLNPATWTSTTSASDYFWAKVRKLVAGDPEKYMVAASRGIEDSLTDAVVSQQTPGLDLKPAFREMPSGDYWVKIAPVGSSSVSARVLPLHFTPHTPALVSTSFQPGLYNLLLVDKAGVPAGSDCWILISSSENYPHASENFQQATRMSAKWPEEMDPTSVRALLRAYLESLSKSPGQP